MSSNSTIFETIKRLEMSTTHEDQLLRALEVYIEVFPVKDAHLYRYSPLGHLGEGIISLSSSSNEIVHIREIRDDVRSLPIIYSTIRERKATYCSGRDFYNTAISKYIFPSHINSLLVTPICSTTTVIGYIISMLFVEGVTIDDDMLSDLTLFGKLVGKFVDSDYMKDSLNLSKRELEVMKRISFGESMKEMAHYMDISEVTVQQYVKSAIKKLDAKNRTHAIAELVRRGLIS
jgi:DNA-binding CsgD family transcriptional regulator